MAKASPWEIKTSPKKMLQPWEWRRRTSSEPMPRAPPVCGRWLVVSSEGEGEEEKQEEEEDMKEQGNGA